MALWEAAPGGGPPAARIRLRFRADPLFLDDVFFFPPMFDLTLFSAESNPRQFRHGEQIFAEGDPGDYMYAILEGEVDITRGGRSIAIIGKGGVFGEMSLIDQKPRSATATARTDLRAVGIDRKRFLDLVHTKPFFAVQMMQILSERVRHNLET